MGKEMSSMPEKEFSAMANNADQNRWDKETDVIVVGYGAAGGISAITAHDRGAKVLLIEKMPHPGGISILSGGGVAFVVEEGCIDGGEVRVQPA